MRIKFAFFGTSDFSVVILEILKKGGFIPSLIITTPDKPQGRNLVMTPSPVKIWAEKNDIRTLSPEKLDSAFINELNKEKWDVFVTASYGKIIPLEILNIPKRKSLNVHPSLLPEFRGPSPIQSMILENKKETGVSIMLMDEEMDHGPIVAQAKIKISEWPNYGVLEKELAELSGNLLVETLPKWVNREIESVPQNHSKATYTKMIEKEDGLIDIEDGNDYLNFRKIMAYERWPRAYFIKNGKRIVINDAKFEDEKLEILLVTPEGKKTMSYRVFKDLRL
jgi:methionyl-tRNA formyltransferase